MQPPIFNIQNVTDQGKQYLFLSYVHIIYVVHYLFVVTTTTSEKKKKTHMSGHHNKNSKSTRTEQKLFLSAALYLSFDVQSVAVKLDK